MVDEMGDDLLAHARFPLDQHRRVVASGDGVGQPQGELHGRALGDDVLEVVVLDKLLPEPLDFPLQFEGLQ